MLKAKAAFNKHCSKCPYKLGIVKTFVNPCPQCKQDNYSTYKRFIQDTEAVEENDKDKKQGDK